MKTVLAILIFFINVVPIWSQDYFHDLSPDIETQATALVQNYTDKLILTEQQELIFQQKIGEFLVRKEKINSQLMGREKLEALKEINREENLEIQEILTPEQFDLYVRLKPSIQPLVPEKPDKE